MARLGRMGFYVTPEAIWAFMQGWKQCVIDSDEPYWISLPDFSDVPNDAGFVSVSWVPLKQLFLLVMEHETFPEVFEGCEIQIHESQAEWVRIQIAMGSPHTEVDRDAT